MKKTGHAVTSVLYCCLFLLFSASSLNAASPQGKLNKAEALAQKASKIAIKAIEACDIKAAKDALNLVNQSAPLVLEATAEAQEMKDARLIKRALDISGRIGSANTQVIILASKLMQCTLSAQGLRDAVEISNHSQRMKQKLVKMNDDIVNAMSVLELEGIDIDVPFDYKVPKWEDFKYPVGDEPLLRETEPIKDTEAASPI